MARMKTQEEYVYQSSVVNPNIEVLGKYINSNTKILHRCKIDGYEWNAYPTHILRGHGCPVCSNKVIIAGVNDLATVRPDLIDYFEDRHEAERHTIGCGCRVNVICPCCGHKKNMLIHHLVTTGFACPYCGDGVSYPNKFCRAMLSQIDCLHVKHEYQPNWAKPYFYDNYFEWNGNKYILEADGSQHFTDNNFGRITLEQIQQTDKIKDDLAVNNDVVIIRIDCRKSELNYIKNNILNSMLSKIFDLSDIDWTMCEKNARTSLLEQICKFYNESNNRQIKYISEQFDLSVATVRKYLQRGNNIGICNYKRHTGKLSVIAYNVNDNKSFTFNSVSSCARELSNLYNIKIENKGILRVCRHKQKLYKGFIFYFKDGDIYA